MTLLEQNTLDAQTRAAATLQSGFPTSATQNTASGVTGTLTKSVTVAAGTNRFMLVATHSEFNTDLPSGVTYNGTAMVKLLEIIGLSQVTLTLWGQWSPAVTTANVVSSWASTTARRVMGVYVFDGVDPVEPLLPIGIFNGSTSAPSLMVPDATANDFLVDFLSLLSTAWALTVGSGQTEAYDIEPNAATVTGSSSYQAGSAGGLMSWTLSGGPSDPTLHLATGVRGNVQANQDVSPTGLGSAAAFGTPTFDVTVDVTGLASAAAFGTAAFKVTIDIPGLGSAATFGTPGFNITGVIPGLGTAAAFGTPGFNGTVDIPGLGSAASFGTPAFALAVAIAGLDSAADFGSPPAFVFGFTPPSLTTAADFGAPTFTTGGVSVSVTGLDTAAAFGTVTFLPGPVSISLTGLGSAAAFGALAVNPGNVNVSMSGLGSSAAFGTVGPQAGPVSVSITGLDSVADFGTPSVTTPSGGQNVNMTGLDTAADFGTVTFTVGGVTVAITGLGSVAALGAMTPSGGAGSPALDPARSGAYFS